MKLNKKNLAINLLLSFLLAENGFARIQGVRTAPGGRGSAASESSKKDETVRTSTVESEKVSSISSTTVASCSSDINNAKYFPQEIFKELSRDGQGLSIELRANNKVVVKIPPTIRVCGSFVPVLKQNKDTKNISVLMKLVAKDDTPEGEDKGPAKGESLTYKQFEDCLIKKEIMVDGKIDHNKLSGDKYSEEIHSMNYDFDKKAEVTKTVTLTYGYPKQFSDPERGYKPEFPISNELTVPGESCMLPEQIADDPVYVNEGKEVILNKIRAICLSGKAQDIAAAKESLGNAEALKDIAEKIKAELDAGYLVAIQKDVERIYADMAKIEDRFSKDGATIDEANAKKLSKEYAALSKRLGTEYMDRAIFRIDTLMKEYEQLDSEDPRRMVIDTEIKKLNDGIATFANRDVFPSLFTVMEKFAINDSAGTIQDVRLKSYHYGRTYPGPADPSRTPQTTFEEAKAKQTAGMKEMKVKLQEWKDMNLASKGDYAPLEKMYKEKVSVNERMNKRLYDYQVSERDKMQEYCGAGMLGGQKNPVQCKQFQAGAKGRYESEMKKRAKDLKFIREKETRLSKMGARYNEFQYKKEKDRESSELAKGANYDPSDMMSSPSSISGYEESFAGRYPQFYQEQQYSPYNQSDFSFGNQQVPMNTSYGNQQMVNPMQPIQQGQYQMQQPRNVQGFAGM
jgi:hypothetical protein